MTATPAALLPPTPPAEAARVMAAQTAAYVALLRGLDSADWSRPTDCTEWDVRAMAAHVAGALEEGARPMVLLRHMRAARDRKSTRLNSSHVKSSYAVFCVK